MQSSTLHLTLTKKAFEVMVTGEKKEEFRKPTQWVRSRLFNRDGTKKHYDFVSFTNGYGNDRPRFTCRFKGVDIASGEWEYSNGLKVTCYNELMISIGNVVSVENITPPSLPIETAGLKEKKAKRVPCWSVKIGNSYFYFYHQRAAYGFAMNKIGGQYPEYSIAITPLEVFGIVNNLGKCCPEGSCDWTTGGGLCLCLTCGETE